jgi:hypothetical protein
MGNVSTNKKLTTDVVVDKSIQDHGNDPGVQEFILSRSPHSVILTWTVLNFLSLNARKWRCRMEARSVAEKRLNSLPSEAASPGAFIDRMRISSILPAGKESVKEAILFCVSETTCSRRPASFSERDCTVASISTPELTWSSSVERTSCTIGYFRCY